MLQFLSRMVFWVLPGIIGCYALWLGMLTANPSRDSVGLYRMMPTRCNSMVFGTSRSAQGVNPEILESASEESNLWLNFSFNLSASPWNEAYVHAIKAKIECSVDFEDNSTFLLFVDPWALDEFVGTGPDSWFLEDWSDVCNISPYLYGLKKTNPLDVIGFGSGSNFLTVLTTVFTRDIRGIFTNDLSLFEYQGLRKNGWLPNARIHTDESRKKAITQKVLHYKNERLLGDKWPGKANVSSLENCITFIQSKAPLSHIILIRPPTSDEMRELELELFPSANQQFLDIAKKNQIPFIDAQYEWKERNNSHFNDGHHMSIDGANTFSAWLANELSNSR